MSNPKTINWGIIGCGDVTEIKSGPAYKKTDGFKLVAVMRRDLTKVIDYAKRHKVNTFYTDADDLINDENVDAVYIATPPDTHKYYALKVAQAGKICCLEKPMTPNYTDSLEVYETFKQKNLPLFVAYYRRSLPRFEKIKAWLAENHIGDIRHISSVLNKPACDIDTSKEYNWRTDAKIAPAGYFDDLASHEFDLFTYFLGDIKEVHGISLNQQNLYSAKDAVTACWVHNNGITGSGCWNFGSHDHLDEVIIYGSKGTISFSVFDDNPIVLKSDSKNESLTIEHPQHIQIHHVEGMRDMLINQNYIHPSTGKTALHTNWIMDRVLGIIPT